MLGRSCRSANHAELAPHVAAQHECLAMARWESADLDRRNVRFSLSVAEQKSKEAPVPDEDRPPQGQGREKLPRTKEMPLAQQREYADWVKKQKDPSPDDKGEMPPDPPDELKEPREHGSKEKEEKRS